MSYISFVKHRLLSQKGNILELILRMPKATKADRSSFLIIVSSPLSLSKKPTPHGRPRWPADHLVPNRILRLFEFQGERERGKFSVFKGLQKPLSAQIQGN
jgi:hypothetical protein